MVSLDSRKVTNYSYQGLIYRTSRKMIENSENPIYLVEHFDGCWHTMSDVVHDEHNQLKEISVPIRLGVVESEIYSEKPREDMRILCFLSEKGEEFFECWKKGLLFDFDLGSPNIEETRINLKRILDGGMFGPSAIMLFNRLDHPELKDLKNQFVFKKLKARMDGVWFFED